MKIIAIIAGAALSFLSHAVVASDLSAKDELRAKLKSFDGYSADFSQTVTDVNGKVLHNAQGRLAFEQPGRFIWRITQPEPELLTSDGETLWWFNPFIEQVSIFDSKQAVEQTPFALLVSQQDDTWQQFSIVKNDGVFEITPSANSNSQVAKLVVAFTSSQQLARISVVSRTQQTSTYDIANSVFADVEDALFKFEIPAGVDIDDQRSEAKQLTSDGKVQY